VKTWQTIPIADCGEPLVALPAQPFAITAPHLYAALGAPYGGRSPWMVRQGVLDALLLAQARLDSHRPGWRLQLFDAWRPVAVQAFMVWREFGLQAAAAGRSLSGCANPAELAVHDPALYATLAETVFMFWSPPSDNPLTPPPHSTGAALDLTLRDAAGQEVDMGCPIDEMSDRAWPNHYAGAMALPLRAFHDNRVLLDEVMSGAGFCRHANEWWHFSLGDQMWAAARREAQAIYGGVG